MHECIMDGLDNHWKTGKVDECVTPIQVGNWEGKGHRDDQGPDHAKPRNNLKDFEFYSLWNKEPLEGFKQDGDMIGNTSGEVK